MPVSLPPHLASQIIWTPNHDEPDITLAPTHNSTTDSSVKHAHTTASATDNSIPKFTFSEGIIAELQAHITQGLSPAAQISAVNAHNFHLEDKKDKCIKEPLITVVYPRDGCHEIIDAAVRGIAQRQKADVLVIDSLELALGELGLYGKDITDAVAAIYMDPVIPDEEVLKDEYSKQEDSTMMKSSEKPPEKESSEKSFEQDVSDCVSDTSSGSFEILSPEIMEDEAEEMEKRKQEHIEREKTRRDHELQDVFDALISLPPSGKSATKARIIYWRDFGNMGKASEPIVLRLFRGMHARRSANLKKGSKSLNLVQPTILVLGNSNWITSERYSFRTPCAAFSRGGSALKKLLPHVGADLITLSDGDITTDLPPPSAGFFLTSLVPDDDDDDEVLARSSATMFNGKFALQDFDISGSTLAIFPKGSDKKKFRKVEELLLGNRRKEVSNAWLRLALLQCGGTISRDVDILGAIGKDKDVEADLLEDEENSNKEAKKESHSSESDLDNEDKTKDDDERTGAKDHICKGSRLLDQVVKHTDAPLPVALERIVTAALGLTPRSAEDATAEVSASSFVKAYMTVNMNAKARHSWWRKNKMPRGYFESEAEDSDDSDEADEKEQDYVVKKVKKAVDDLNKYEKLLLTSIVDIAELDTSFEDVCISESTVDTLRTIVSLPLLFPTAFKTGVLAREAIGGVLLYGPPGTGKTLVCRAVARECGARMLAIKPSDILDCYVGESEKLVSAVFSLAYRLAPCLVFIDELDSLFRKRQDDDKKWVRDILAEFLQGMEGLRSAKKNKEAGVVVIGATNRPYDLDDAVLRRLPSRMLVDVPTEEERENILRLHLRDETLEGLTLNEIARKTVHYTGSDLKNLCVSAAMASVKESIGTFSWKLHRPKAEEGKDVKKKGKKKGKKKMDDKMKEKIKDEETSETVEARERISKRTVKMSHFLQAMNDVPASSAAGSHREIRRWHEQFGRKSPISTGSNSAGTSQYFSLLQGRR